MSGHSKWSEIEHKADGPFAWVYDKQTKRVHKWHDEHPERDHRSRAESVLGRPVKTTAGDVLGVANWVDGEWKLESYYGASIPEAVRIAFPDRARISALPYVYEYSAAEWAQEHLALSAPTLKQRIKRVFGK